MPYEYRKLTPAEKEEIVNQRRERGFPLHAPPHPYRDGCCYMICAANYEHAPIMDEPARRTEFETRLLQVFQSNSAEICGWVVLPNHYHILVIIQSFDSVPTVLKSLHGSTSIEWNRADGLIGKRRVWYKYYDRMIRNDAHYFQALNYIHYNPVKHGYVQSSYEWQWSSLSMYYEDQGREWLRECWSKFKPEPSGVEWGDVE